MAASKFSTRPRTNPSRRTAAAARALVGRGVRLGRAAEREQIGGLGPIGVDRPPCGGLAAPRRRGRLRKLASCRAAALRLAGVARSRGKSEHAKERHGEAGELVRSKRKILPAVNGDLIVELDLFRSQRPAESEKSLAQASLRINGLRRTLSESDAMQEPAEI